MALTEKDLQQLLSETKKLACMNRNLKIAIQNTNFLKYFHDCMYKAIKDGYIKR